MRDNIARGKKAITRALSQKEDVPSAMFRPECGPIDFVWGTPGEKAAERAGGYGISHAFAKHPDDIKLIPEIIAKGTAYKVKSKGRTGTLITLGALPSSMGTAPFSWILRRKAKACSSPVTANAAKADSRP